MTSTDLVPSGLNPKLGRHAPWSLSFREAWAPGADIRIGDELVSLNRLEASIVRSSLGLRLRDLPADQPGVSDRFHSMLRRLRGVQWLYERLLEDARRLPPHDDLVSRWITDPETGTRELAEAIVLTRAAALVHDLGHLPFESTLERDLGLIPPLREDPERVREVINRLAGTGDPMLGRFFEHATEALLHATVGTAAAVSTRRSGTFMSDVVRLAGDPHLLTVIEAKSAAANPPRFLVDSGAGRCSGRLLLDLRHRASPLLPAAPQLPQGRPLGEPVGGHPVPMGFAPPDAAEQAVVVAWLGALTERDAPRAQDDAAGFQQRAARAARELRIVFVAIGRSQALNEVDHRLRAALRERPDDRGLRIGLEQLRTLDDPFAWRTLDVDDMIAVSHHAWHHRAAWSARCADIAADSAAAAGIEAWKVILVPKTEHQLPPACDLLVDTGEAVQTLAEYTRRELGWPPPARPSLRMLACVHHSVDQRARRRVEDALTRRWRASFDELFGAGEAERHLEQPSAPEVGSEAQRRLELRRRFLRRTRSYNGLDRDALREVHEHGWTPPTDDE